VLYIIVNNMSFHSSTHILVIMLAVPGEKTRDIWNKCVVGGSTNCDISKIINKTNTYNHFGELWAFSEF
jgi:hypothetical protein